MAEASRARLCRSFEFGATFTDRGVQCVARDVQALRRELALRFGQLAEPLERFGYLALLAEILDSDAIERRRIGGLCNGRKGPFQHVLG